MAETQLSSSLTGTGSTDPVIMRNGIVRLSGTFSATLQVEVDALANNTWAPALDGSGAAISVTVPGVLKIENGVSCPTRVTCTAYTSGTVNVALRGGS